MDSKKVPASEKYSIVYKADDTIHYNTEIEIIPKATFEKDKTYYMFESGFKEATVKNAETAYELSKYSNSMIEPSTYKLIALKGDVCYIISAYFKGYSQMEASGSYYDYNKKRLQKYLDDTKNMISSFELSDKPMDFNTIAQSSQSIMQLDK